VADGRRALLSRDDWLAAALAALLAGGPDAVAMEPIAATLGATKGSGYWHFAGRPELLRATMDRWVAQKTDGVVADIEASGGDPVARVGRLLAVVTGAVEHSPAEPLIMASSDPVVRAAAVRAVRTRVEYLEKLLREKGFSSANAHTRAVLGYATYVGHGVLAATTPQLLPKSVAARARAHRDMLDMVLGDGGRTDR